MNRLFFIAGFLAAFVPLRAQVTRAEALETAHAYLTFNWTPSERNVCHGNDPDGIRVDTPDIGFRPAETRPGWWVPNRRNIGVPYMWGGFSSLDEFAEGVRAGKFAGDIYTTQKRVLLEKAVSKHVIGIDCSGLISRCWRLDRCYSTREFPSLCLRLSSYHELKPGDILNSFNNHALLFYRFKDAREERLLAYEAGSPPTWKVLLNDIPVAMLKDQGFVPYRYARIRD
jgi:hypothetical protein